MDPYLDVVTDQHSKLLFRPSTILIYFQRWLIGSFHSCLTFHPNDLRVAQSGCCYSRWPLTCMESEVYAVCGGKVSLMEANKGWKSQDMRRNDKDLWENIRGQRPHPWCAPQHTSWSFVVKENCEMLRGWGINTLWTRVSPNAHHVVASAVRLRMTKNVSCTSSAFALSFVWLCRLKWSMSILR